MICNKCKGKVFVDFTFTTGRDYEIFCICCGKRWFITPTHPIYGVVDDYVKSKEA